MNQETTNFKTFNYQENGEIGFSMLATVKTTNTLDSGIYDLKTIHNFQTGYKNVLAVTDNTETFEIDIPFYFKDKIDTVFNKFYSEEIKKDINNLGYKHKLGILLYGKQGTGKTSMLKFYFQKSKDCCDAVVFNLTSLEHFSETWGFIKNIRKIQSNPIVVFIDECEDLFEKYKQEDSVKKALDGFDSIDNCLVLMSTNYIDKIPTTIKDRPSRVKYSIEVDGIQDEKLITQFLKQSFDKIDMKVDFEKEVSKMKGWTIDELKQWVLDKVMDIEPETKQGKKLGFGK